MLGELLHDAFKKLSDGALDITGFKKELCNKLEDHLTKAQAVFKTKSDAEVDKFFADARAELEKLKAI